MLKKFWIWMSQIFFRLAVSTTESETSSTFSNQPYCSDTFLRILKTTKTIKNFQRKNQINFLQIVSKWRKAWLSPKVHLMPKFVRRLS